jgi:predicted unusual protein kinase regulating ubiquinone biosynthesis (AarF/ABC1/UbiB family)
MGSNLARVIFKDDFKFGWIAAEFEKKLPLELDFRLEAANCIECKEMFKKTDSVHIPKVYEQYTNPRVIVMSYEDGIPLNRVK